MAKNFRHFAVSIGDPLVIKEEVSRIVGSITGESIRPLNRGDFRGTVAYQGKIPEYQNEVIEIGPNMTEEDRAKVLRWLDEMDAEDAISRN